MISQQSWTNRGVNSSHCEFSLKIVLASPPLWSLRLWQGYGKSMVWWNIDMVIWCHVSKIICKWAGRSQDIHRYPRSNGFNDSAGRIYVILCPYFWPYSIFRHLYQCIEDIKILPHQLGIKHATLNEGCMQSLARDIILSLPQKTCCTTLYHVVPSGNFT